MIASSVYAAPTVTVDGEGAPVTTQPSGSTRNVNYLYYPDNGNIAIWYEDRTKLPPTQWIYKSVSTDGGNNWGTEVAASGGLGSFYALQPKVRYIDGRYSVFFWNGDNSANSKIMYGKSYDKGLTWQNLSQVQISGAVTGQYYYNFLDVIKLTDGTYRGFAENNRAWIDYLDSTDLIHWTRKGEALGPTACTGGNETVWTNNFNGISPMGSVMYYTENGANRLGLFFACENGTSGQNGVGFAYSADEGATWTVSNDMTNPLVKLTGTIGGQQRFLEDLFVLPTDATNFNLFYDAKPNPALLYKTTGTFGGTGIAGFHNNPYNNAPSKRTTTWDGGGSDNEWQNGPNWIGDVEPNADDSLTFTGTVRLNPHNNYATGTQFDQIRFTAGGFTLSGNDIALTGGIDNPGGTNAINTNIKLSNDQTFQNYSVHGGNGNNAVGTELTVGGAVDTNGKTLTLAGVGTTTFAGGMSGSGGMIVNMNGTVNITSNCAYTGVTHMNDKENMSVHTAEIVITGANGSLSGTSNILIGHKDAVTVDNATSVLADFVNGVDTNTQGRIGDATDITLEKHSSLTLKGNPTANIEETFGTLYIGKCDSWLEIENTAGHSTVLRGAEMVQLEQNGRIDFIGDGLGNTGNAPRMMFDLAPTLTNEIIPYATVNTKYLATYGETGIKPYTVHKNGLSDSVSSDNVKSSGSETLSGAAAVNSLVVDNTGGATVIDGGTSLTVGSGMILANTAATIDVPVLDFGTATGMISNAADMTISSDMTGAALTKSGAGTLTITSTANNISGTVTVSGGQLNLEGVLGDVAVQAGAEVTGAGALAILSGSGLVGPGNSPGILTVSQVDPSGGLDWSFEFTAARAPAYDAPTASINDVLRITHSGQPFLSALTSGNLVNIFFNLDAVDIGDAFTGGFYSDAADFGAMIEEAEYAFYLKDDNGSVTYNEQNYSLLTGALAVSLSVMQENADFGSGIVSGYVTRFEVQEGGEVPEPSTLLLLLLPLVGFGLKKHLTKSHRKV